PLSAIGIFCEDIREEKSGQVTLVGILPDNVVMPRIPPEIAEKNPSARPIIPRIALYVRVHVGADEAMQPLRLKLILPNDSEMEIGTIDTDLITKSQNEAR